MGISVPRKDGQPRFCVDCRSTINKRLIRKTWTMPNLEETFTWSEAPNLSVSLTSKALNGRFPFTLIMSRLQQTRATIEMHHSFSEVPHFGSLILLPKTVRGKIKLVPDEKSHSLGIQRESCKEMTGFRRFWAKEPRHSNISHEKCYLYCSTRQHL